MRLLFVTNVFRDQSLADRLAQQLAAHYPEAQALFIPDEPRLKTILTGEWTQRYLEVSLNYGPDIIIKLDPDTCVWRRTKIPDADWFGEISACRTFIHGYACGFSKTAATKLVASKLLLLPSPFFYRWPHDGSDDTPMSYQDMTVGAAMAKLQISPRKWNDILTLWHGKIPHADQRAISHPHPAME